MNTGIRNLVLIGFLIFTAKDTRGKEKISSPAAEKHPTCPDRDLYRAGVPALEEELAIAK